MARVSVPILPTNMEMVIIIFASNERFGVIPVDSPTVEMAETSAKIREIKDLSGSKILRKNTEIKRNINEKSAMEKALSIIVNGIVRR